jgi:hypothetical protein
MYPGVFSSQRLGRNYIANFGAPARVGACLISADYKSSWCMTNNKHGALIQYTENTSLNRESFCNLKKATAVLLPTFCWDAPCTQTPAVAHTNAHRTGMICTCPERHTSHTQPYRRNMPCVQHDLAYGDVDRQIAAVRNWTLAVSISSTFLSVHKEVTTSLQADPSEHIRHYMPSRTVHNVYSLLLSPFSRLLTVSLPARCLMKIQCST